MKRAFVILTCSILASCSPAKPKPVFFYDHTAGKVIRISPATAPESKKMATVDPLLASLRGNMTTQDADILRQQLAHCWSIQTAGGAFENLAVEVQLTVSPERRIMEASVVDKNRYDRDKKFRLVADSAIHALNRPECEILDLPPQKYDLWKDIVVVFDPRDLR